jgi:hypothetical protein
MRARKTANLEKIGHPSLAPSAEINGTNGKFLVLWFKTNENEKNYWPTCKN